MNFSSVFYGYLLIGSFKTFGSKYIHDDMYLTLVGSVGCIFGSLRFFWSMLLDFNYSYPQVYGILIFLQLICSSLIFYAAQGQNKALFMVLTAFTMFCEGGHFVLVPSHCAQIFNSSKRGVQVFSYLFSCFGLSSIAGSIV